jgi:hypothetical protein
MYWSDIFQKACNSLFDWGPGVLIAAMILYGLYKLLLRLGRDVGMKIVGALEKPATALNQQAESMDRLTRSIEGFVSRDQTEHREIIMLQKVILDRIERIRNGKEG